MNIYVLALVSMAIALLIFLLILLLVKSYFIFVDKHINRKIVNAIYILITFAILYSFVLLAVYADSTKA